MNNYPIFPSAYDNTATSAGSFANPGELRVSLQERQSVNEGLGSTKIGRNMLK